MPLQNRVDPFGRLVATSHRGKLMGNRGLIHGSHQNIEREFRGKRWIYCVLDFKGRRRKPMTPGLYTELFFLDEATAIAAGHRPCAECQRERYNQFRIAWGNPKISAGEMDEILHAERMVIRRNANPDWLTLEQAITLPGGVMLACEGGNAYAVRAGQLAQWSFAGYSRVTTPPHRLRLLTCPSIVRVLRSFTLAD